VVECLTHNPKVEGSNVTTVAKSKNSPNLKEIMVSIHAQIYISMKIGYALAAQW
jgi:hypothetical protein